MSAVENRQMMQDVYAELGVGNSKPFVECLAEDVRWTIRGTTKWSRTFEGKEAVLTKLIGPLFEQFADRYTATADRFIAEGDFVVAEVQGRVTTKTGKLYNNRYCYIFRIVDGKVRELIEYLDTQLVVEVFGN
jgi:ketosteroid isomerase-like protein